MKKLSLIALIAFAASTPAVGQAAKGETKKSCPKEAMCVWTKADYEGKRKVFKEPGTYNLGKFNNRVSSVKSKWTKSDTGLSYLYERRNAKGEYRCFSPNGVSASDLHQPNWDFGDEGSSVLLPKGDAPSCF